MITIRNISKVYGKGKQFYELWINREPICQFEHTFEDGLAECLRKAAKAVDKEGGKRKE